MGLYMKLRSLIRNWSDKSIVIPSICGLNQNFCHQNFCIGYEIYESCKKIILHLKRRPIKFYCFYEICQKSFLHSRCYGVLLLEVYSVSFSWLWIQQFRHISTVVCIYVCYALYYFENVVCNINLTPLLFFMRASLSDCALTLIAS